MFTKLNITHTHTQNRFTAPWILSGTTRVSWYQKKHSPTNITAMTKFYAKMLIWNFWVPIYRNSDHLLPTVSMPVHNTQKCTSVWCKYQGLPGTQSC